MLERTLDSPLHSKEIKPVNSKGNQYSWEGLMLKLQYFGHLMQRTDLLEKTLMPGKIEGKRRGRQRMKWLYGITDSMDMSPSKLQEIQSRRSRTTQRDGVRRDVGEGFRNWGGHVYPWLIDFEVWPKPPQHCKVIIFQLK